MATRSILKTVHIQNPQSAEKFISALERAAVKLSTKPEISAVASDASREDIYKIFRIAK